MTDRALLLRPLARADIGAILAYCRTEGGATLAKQFAQHLEGALSTLAAHPAIGSRRYADLLQIPGLRSWPIGKTAYLILYIDELERIDIWRVLHGRRDISALLGDPDESSDGDADTQ